MTDSTRLPARPRTGGTLYRGGPGMWAWVAHRITGVLTFFFLFVHVLDTALVRVSPESYDRVVEIYKSPVMAVVEVVLIAAVLFHALNGLRIIVIDWWAQGPRYQRQLIWAVLIGWLVLMIPGAFVILRHTVQTWFGSK